MTKNFLQSKIIIVFLESYEPGGCVSHYTFLPGLGLTSPRRHPNHWKSRQNRATDSGDANFANIQIGSAFRWSPELVVYIATGLPRVGPFDVTGLCGHSNLFKVT